MTGIHHIPDMIHHSSVIDDESKVKLIVYFMNTVAGREIVSEEEAVLAYKKKRSET